MKLNQIIENFSTELNDFLRTGELDWGLFLEFSNYYSKIAPPSELVIASSDPVAWVNSQITKDFAF